MSEPMVAKVHVEDMHVFFDLMTLKLDVFGHHNRLLVWFVCDLTHCMSAEVQHPPWWWQQHAVIIVFGNAILNSILQITICKLHHTTHLDITVFLKKIV